MSSTTKDEDEYEKKRSIPVFMGVDDLENYRSFMTMFKGWEDKEDTWRSTSLEALVEQLPTTQKYWNGWRESREVDEDGDENVIHVPLTDKEKQLYKDNAKSRNKLSLYVRKDILELMLTAGGPKQSVWLIKQWFEQNYGDARREDTLQDLIRQFNELHPGDFTEAMLYIGKVDSLNTCLGKIEAKYMKSDLELIIMTLTKIPDNKDGKTSVWGPF
jgi:hypothetical protein